MAMAIINDRQRYCDSSNSPTSTTRITFLMHLPGSIKNKVGVLVQASSRNR